MSLKERFRLEDAESDKMDLKRKFPTKEEETLTTEATVCAPKREEEVNLVNN